MKMNDNVALYLLEFKLRGNDSSNQQLLSHIRLYRNVFSLYNYIK